MNRIRPRPGKPHIWKQDGQWLVSIPSAGWGPTRTYHVARDFFRQ